MPSLLLELELTACPVVLVGLGAVGRRRLQLLLEAGARVRVIEPQALESAYTATLPEAVTLVQAAYEAGQLAGARLVFAAATPQVNCRVAEDAQRLGIWVNVASDPCAGTLRVPALWRDGPVQLAVTTGGASPSLAALARTRAAEAIGFAPGKLAALLAELRPLVLARIADPQVRAALFKRWAEPEWLQKIEQEGAELVRQRLLEEIKRVASGV